MMNNIYKEKQSFWTWWLCIILFAFFGYELFGVFSAYIDSGVLSFGVGFWIMLIIIVGFVFMRLTTTIDSKGIEITFIPFAYKKRWQWTDVDQVYVRTYSLKDFGGWGYRISSQGVAYNTRGKNGIQIILKEGTRVMIGTQKPELLNEVIAKYKV